MRNPILLLVLVSLLVGCSSGLCPTVVKSVVQAQTQVSDGFRALDQAGAIVHGAPMSEITRQEFNKSMSQAFAALTAVNTILASSLTACNEPRLDDKFAAFNKAWFTIKDILSLFSEHGVHVSYIGAGMSADVPDPIFYKEP